MLLHSCRLKARFCIFSLHRCRQFGTTFAICWRSGAARHCEPQHGSSASTTPRFPDAWRRLSERWAGSSFNAWAMGIARNKALQFFERAGSDRHRFSSDLLMQLADTHERLSDQVQAQREALAACIERLPDKSLALLKRRYVQDHKPGRIAESLGLSANAVRLSLHRIRKALRTCIEQRLQEN